MTADIVPFGKKAPKRVNQITDDLRLPPPAETDLIGFINVLDYLSMQSISGSVTIDLLDDIMKLTVRQHHEVTDVDGVATSSGLEYTAGCDFNPENQKLLIVNILKLFHHIDIDNHDNEAK